MTKSPKVATPAFSQATRAEGIRFLYRNLNSLIPGLAILPCVIAWSVWGYIDHVIVVSWLSIALLVIVLRFWLNYRFHKLTPDTKQVFIWGRYFTYTSLLTGVVYGSAAFLLFVPDSLPLQLLLFTIIIGLTSGSIFVTSHWLESYYALMIPALGMASLSLFLQSDSGYQLLSFAIFAYLLMSIGMGKRSSESVLNSIQLRFENTELLHQLTISKEKAEQANARKTRFLASASHDLRQPVHALNLFTDALSQEPLTDKSNKLLSFMRESVEALSQLLSSLLDISKLDAGIVTPKLTSVDMSDLLNRLYRNFLPLAEKKKLDLRLRCHSAPFVMSDPVLLENILRNLIDNAIKYTSEGGILVSCRSRKNHELWLEVIDTGDGISPVNQEFIFEEFYQINNMQRDRRQGLGLGLAIVKRQALLLGHQLNVKSRQGKGSVFRLCIEQNNHNNVYSLVEEKEGKPLLTQKNAHILVVDDDPLVLEGTKTILENWHYSVSTASGLEQALKIIAATKIDIIISDFSLEGTDGITAIEALRKKSGNDIPALLITGDTAPARIKAAKDSGMALLHKPVNVAKLRTALHFHSDIH
ncbi:MAG: hypothetical protein CMH22_13825 [Methylophaga sp.]|uniref:ATP-binding response regulator n=1 Tax=Methylophaga sp. UBA678 TaxID=1946901 RepID=UPI000C610AC1|nr:ATP-binding protein [Methylophaga sp. UBA678]MAX53051.1 hypothetical protein [Methylophaga sp.]|tara:strand:- start:32840 stop:34597 length:1758 start_codon:yes stop_codon:yes gene_type:complete